MALDMMNNIAKANQPTQMTNAQNTQPKVSQTEQMQQQQMQQDQKAESSEIKKLQNESDVENLVKDLNKAIDPFNTSLRFGFDNTAEVFFVSVIDTASSKIIRRFPAEEAVSLAEKMMDVNGMLFDEKG